MESGEPVRKPQQKSLNKRRKRQEKHGDIEGSQAPHHSLQQLIAVPIRKRISEE
jgi:hypothetical protein